MRLNSDFDQCTATEVFQMLENFSAEVSDFERKKEFAEMLVITSSAVEYQIHIRIIKRNEI